MEKPIFVINESPTVIADLSPDDICYPRLKTFIFYKDKDNSIQIINRFAFGLPL